MSIKKDIRLFWIITGFVMLLPGCGKTVYVPTVKIEKEIETIRDTIIHVKLVPYYSENTTDKDSSFLENEYAYSFAYWDGLFLRHNLGIKNFEIPVNIKYVDRWHIKIDSISQIKEVPVKGDTVYKMKWYEEIFFYIGLLAALLGGAYAVFRLIKKKFFG